MNFRKFVILVASPERPELAVDAYGKQYFMPEHQINIMEFPCFGLVTEESVSKSLIEFDEHGIPVSATDESGRKKTRYTSAIGLGHVFQTMLDLEHWHSNEKYLQSL